MTARVLKWGKVKAEESELEMAVWQGPRPTLLALKTEEGAVSQKCRQILETETGK